MGVGAVRCSRGGRQNFAVCHKYLQNSAVCHHNPNGVLERTMTCHSPSRTLVMSALRIGIRSVHTSIKDTRYLYEKKKSWDRVLETVAAAAFRKSHPW